MQPRLVDGRQLERRVRSYLERTDRDGDHDRIAQRLAERHVTGTPIVGFRRGGQEVFLYDPPTPESNAVTGAVRLYEIGRDGQLTQVGRISLSTGIDRWLAHHRSYFEWLAPAFRTN